MSKSNPTEQPNEKQGALHTPGPWAVGGSHKAEVRTATSLFFTQRWDTTVKSAELEANAALIAAAPDLLAAARAVVAASESMCQGDVLDTSVLEAAIAKAEGQ